MGKREESKVVGWHFKRTNLWGLRVGLEGLRVKGGGLSEKLRLEKDLGWRKLQRSSRLCE